MREPYALFEAGFKVLLRRGDEVLFLKKPRHEHWDLPGGRMNSDELLESFARVIDREIREELGENLVYELGRPLYQYTLVRKEDSYPILGTVYEATYKSGDMVLSSEHESMTWLKPSIYQFAPAEFCSKEEFAQIVKYCEAVFHR